LLGLAALTPQLCIPCRLQAGVSARAAYSKEIPSMSSPPPRMVTAMSMGGGGGGAPGQAPPDLPSLLLNARICYLGMPLVPAVTELIVAQLLWLNFDQPEKPVYFYVNSTGSQTPEGQSVGFETEAYAIMDTMQYVRPDIHTVCIGKAYGNAAMLLASGKKGCRYVLPHASVMLCPPRMNRKVDSATNLMISANELDDNTKTYVEYLTEFTGKEEAVLRADIARTRYFTPQQALEYGLADKVVNPQSGGLADKKDYEAMLKAAGGGASSRPSYAGARGGGD
jgi:ATP-dependent Clp protease protease subunit